MRKKDNIYWSNVAKKPKGFSSVKGQSFVYTCLVPIKYIDKDWFEKDIDLISIEMKMDYTEWGYDLNKDVTSCFITKKINTDKYRYQDSMFYRDNRMFPFVSGITLNNLYEKDKYLNHKRMTERRLKLNRIMEKIS